ncbi:ATP-binding protein [Streptomyces sp. NPDC004610]|uniref:ATP-binding protein n=1 Tax=unclassified Streptomyces TaxID=2593676 RepID=UPI0033AA0E17
MKRQVRGGGPRVVGSGPAQSTGAGAAEEGQRRPRLRRRLGRADLRAVPEARRAVRELLHTWERSEQSQIAELLTSELVTNALVHTDRDAVLTAEVGPHGVRVEVRDFVAQRPRPRPAVSHEATHGRGLALVESLADSWGVHSHGVGKSVWFELGAEAA